MAQQEYGMGHSMVYGQWLGWMMTAIYMGGRIPQIWLNVSPNFVSWVYFCLATFAASSYVVCCFIRSKEEAWRYGRARTIWTLV